MSRTPRGLARSAFCRLPPMRRAIARIEALERERTALVTQLEDMRRAVARIEALERERAALVTQLEDMRRRSLALVAERDELLRERAAVLGRISTAADVVERMRSDWDRRARLNAAFYVHSGAPAWTEGDYLASGEANVREQILTDMTNICQGRDPKQMRIVEIGCGTGRMTRALAQLFGEVHGVDISAEMIARARRNLHDVPNAFVYQNSGADLQVLPQGPFDFAFSFIVFQHIPSKEVIERYVREVFRLLRPGALFKFQVQGWTEVVAADTWLGAGFSVEEMRELALRSGFELRYYHGEGTQYFWLWFFKP